MVLVAVALHMSALGVSSASAVEVGTEVADPSTAVTHCSAVTAATHGVGSGGCKLHLASVGQVKFATIFGRLTR